MAGQSASTIKAWFLTKMKPTAAQFGELIDSLFEKAESILPTATNSFNLGSAIKRFKDLFLSGDANIAGSANITTDITVDGSSEVKVISKAKVFRNSALTTNVCNTAVDIKLDESNVQYMLIDQDVAIDFINRIPGVFWLILEQDGTGHAVAFSAGNELKVGSVSSNPSQIDMLKIVCDGVDVYIDIINNYRV